MITLAKDDKNGECVQGVLSPEFDECFTDTIDDVGARFGPFTTKMIEIQPGSNDIYFKSGNDNVTAEADGNDSYRISKDCLAQVIGLADGKGGWNKYIYLICDTGLESNVFIAGCR